MFVCPLASHSPSFRFLPLGAGQSGSPVPQTALISLALLAAPLGATPFEQRRAENPEDSTGIDTITTPLIPPEAPISSIERDFEPIDKPDDKPADDKPADGKPADDKPLTMSVRASLATSHG